jgi:N-acetylglucosamine malate deacetylase 1
MKRVLFIAPHPDDETLAAGGTLLRLNSEGIEIHWIIMTEMRESENFIAETIKKRQQEISSVSKAYNFKSMTQLKFIAGKLDIEPIGDIISSLADAVKQIEPDTIFVPYRGDAHSDHRITFDAAAACSKTFRYSFVKRFIACEILSETDFGMDPTELDFKPNLYFDISEYLDSKIDIMKQFVGEMGEHPFPRSTKSIKALANLRGSQAGVSAAEAFMILKEIR